MTGRASLASRIQFEVKFCNMSEIMIESHCLIIWTVTFIRSKVLAQHQDGSSLSYHEHGAQFDDEITVFIASF